MTRRRCYTTSVFLAPETLEAIGREVCARIAAGWPGPNISAVIRDAVESFPEPPPEPLAPGVEGRHVPYRHTWPPHSPLRLDADGIRGALTAYLAQPVAARARGQAAGDRRRS